MDIKLRYNTECKGENNLYWRVLIDGEQHLASNVIINVPVTTTMDFVENVGYKHHVSCKANNLIWKETELTIE